MINLLSPQSKEDLLREEHFKIILILGIIAVAFLICLVLNIFYIKIHLSGQIEEQKFFLEAEEKKFQVSGTQKIESEILSLNKELKNLEYFYKKKFSVTSVIEKIFNTLPAGLYLERLNYSPLQQTSKENNLAQISLSGFSPTREDLIKFRENLENEEIFNEVNFPPSNWVEPIDIKFSVTFKLAEPN
jgi:Tfp pilus assembly protein PilN